MPSTIPKTLESVEPVLLSPVEALFWRLEEALVGSFRVTVLIRLDGCIEVDFLTAALQQLQRRHPKLRAAIVGGDHGRLHFKFDQVTPFIPFEVIDYDEDEAPWREETRRLMQGRFPAAGPLVAVTVLRNRSRGASELLLTAHHAIADGLSAIMLANDLLTEYGRAEAHIEETRPVLPAVAAQRAKIPGGWLGRLRLFRRVIRLQRKEKRSRQSALPHARAIPPQSQWVHWVFFREDTLRLVRHCRKASASLGGVLVAAVCCGLMDCLPLPEAMFKCTIPFDLREALEGAEGPVTNQDLGCFASIMNEFYDVPRQSEFWDLARRAHQNHQAFAQLGGPAFNYNLAAVLTSRIFKFARSKLLASSTERVTLLATNYGVVDTCNTYGSLRPRACTLMLKNDLIGPSLVIEALVMGQQLNIGFAADGLDPAFWDQLELAVRRRLDAAASAGENSSSKA